MFLVDPIARQDYEMKLNKRRIDTISSIDTDITQKCQVRVSCTALNHL